MSALRGLLTSFMRTRRRRPGMHGGGMAGGPAGRAGSSATRRQDAMIGRQVRKFLGR